MSLVLADVSEFQGWIAWASYGAANPAVIVRVHNGWRSDYNAAANIAGARSACQWRGFYQYLPATVDPAAAAHAFVTTLLLQGGIQPGEVVILDLEEGDGDQTARAAAWHAAVRSALPGTCEWTYSGAAFARAHLGDSVDWIASYGSGEPSDAHTLWQFTDAQRFTGITGSCDASVYDGSLAQLIAATGGSPAPTSSTTTTTAPGVSAAQARQEFGPMKVLDVEKLPTAPASPFEGVLVTESFLTALATTDEKDACIRIDEAQTGDVVLLAEVNLVRGVFARGRAGL